MEPCFALSSRSFNELVLLTITRAPDNLTQASLIGCSDGQVSNWLAQMPRCECAARTRSGRQQRASAVPWRGCTLPWHYLHNWDRKRFTSQSTAWLMVTTPRRSIPVRILRRKIDKRSRCCTRRVLLWPGAQLLFVLFVQLDRHLLQFPDLVPNEVREDVRGAGIVKRAGALVVLLQFGDWVFDCFQVVLVIAVRLSSPRLCSAARNSWTLAATMSSWITRIGSRRPLNSRMRGEAGMIESLPTHTMPLVVRTTAC